MTKAALVHKTMDDLMEERVETGAARPAFACAGRTFTWEECDALSDLMAVKLLERGLGKGDRVGVWSLNDISEVLLLIAAMKVGVVPAVVNYSYKQRELEAVVRRAGLKTLFIGKQKCNTDYWQMGAELSSRLDEPLLLVGILEDFEQAVRAVKMGYRMTAGQREVLCAAAGAVCPEDAAALVFTSGSTKEPKPVLLSFDNIVNDVRGFDARLGVGPGDTILAPLPLFHCSGLTGLLFHAAVSGAMGVIQPMFQAEETLQLIQDYRASVLMLVPTMAELMMASPEFGRFDLSSLRSALFSGSEITTTNYLKMRRELKLDCILNAYGQTECSPIVTTTLPDDDMKAASETVGVPLDGVRVRVCDVGTDRELGVGQTGEIQVMGFNTMIGYCNYPEEMAMKYAADGWLKTGDAGWLDKDGRLHFARRLSETIIRGGENISPAEIEEAVMAFSPDIQITKAVGVPSVRYGEEIACILQAKGQVNLGALREFIRSNLATYKCPKYLFQVQDMPRTDTDKVSLRGVRELAERLVAEQLE